VLLTPPLRSEMTMEQKVAMVADMRNGLSLLTAVEFTEEEASFTVTQGGVDALIEVRPLCRLLCHSGSAGYP
jgi:hypothetical protein